MHIAVDAHNIKAVKTDEEHHVLRLLYKLIQSHPEHHFTVISLQTGLLPALPSITEYITTTRSKNYFQLRRWYRKTLPALLSQIGADLFIGINCTTAGMDIPQLIFLSSPTAAEQPFAGRFPFMLYKNYLNRQVAKADAIATFTQLQQSVTAKHLNIDASRIIPVGYAVPAIFKPVSWQQKEKFFDEHTHGSEYFLYTGLFAEDTFMLVLKAFSLFKKRQLSSMQLIAAGTFTSGKNIREKLASYKYRSDVKCYQNADLQTMAALTSGAYAVVCLDEKALTAFPAAAALQCEVPVVGLDGASAIQEVAGSAGLYASATPESLAEQMKMVYKDENLRKLLVTNAAAQATFLNGDAASQKLWDSIAMAATKIRLHLPLENEPDI